MSCMVVGTRCVLVRLMNCVLCRPTPHTFLYGARSHGAGATTRGRGHHRGQSKELTSYRQCTEQLTYDQPGLAMLCYAATADYTQAWPQWTTHKHGQDQSTQCWRGSDLHCIATAPGPRPQAKPQGQLAELLRCGGVIRTSARLDCSPPCR
ncbi:hypothetical protein V8C86DRAFT_2943977 [Haematococcus lacustris]